MQLMTKVSYLGLSSIPGGGTSATLACISLIITHREDDDTASTGTILVFAFGVVGGGCWN